VNAYKTGVSFGAGVRRAFLRDWFSVQTELLYATRGTDVDLTGNTEGSFYFTYLELPVLARLRIPWLVDDGAVRPTISGYVILGPSVSVLLGAEGVDAAGTRSLSRNDLNEVDLGGILGLGVTWEVAPEWALSLEARFDQGVRDAFKEVDTKNQAFLLTLGVDFTIGHGDSDGDRVADYRDRCRSKAEDVNDHEDDDGCPDGGKGVDNDKDRDGILAGNDKCPEKPEDKNDYKDEDGCPDAHLRDTDQDGLADVKDECPDEPFSGTGKTKYDAMYGQEKHGCPVVSIDGDGDQLALDPMLMFDPGVEVLSETQTLILDEVAFFWKGRPKLCLRVEGHSDKRLAQGQDEKQNEEESRLRAERVRDYLVGSGVDRGYLIPKGYGSRLPAHDEDTPKGMRKNRRVRFAIVAQSECDRANKPGPARR
jgi:outer membrane protein OmpA-like peptidoglycan-associated protein